MNFISPKNPTKSEQDVYLIICKFHKLGRKSCQSPKNENVADFPKTPLFLIMPETPKDQLHSLGPQWYQITQSRSEFYSSSRIHALRLRGKNAKTHKNG